MSKPEIKIRRAEPSDAEAMRKIFESPKVIHGTLRLPFPSTENWRKRLAEPSEGGFYLLALVNDEVGGQSGLYTFPRRRHGGQIVWLFVVIGKGKVLVLPLCKP